MALIRSAAIAFIALAVRRFALTGRPVTPSSTPTPTPTHDVHDRVDAIRRPSRVAVSATAALEGGRA